MQADIPGAPSPISPQPSPVPTPAPVPPASGLSLSTLLVLVAVGVAVWYFAFRRGDPPAPPAPPGPSPSAPEAVGRDFAKKLVASYADAVTDTVPGLEGGQSVADFQAAFAKSWSAKRSAAFQAVVTPTLSGIIPEGTEPDPKTADGAATRARFAAAWRGIASGMRAGQ